MKASELQAKGAEELRKVRRDIARVRTVLGTKA